MAAAVSAVPVVSEAEATVPEAEATVRAAVTRAAMPVAGEAGETTVRWEAEQVEIVAMAEGARAVLRALRWHRPERGPRESRG